MLMTLRNCADSCKMIVFQLWFVELYHNFVQMIRKHRSKLQVRVGSDSLSFCLGMMLLMI
jgi:hypothetical protein